MMLAYSRCFAASFEHSAALPRISEKPMIALSGVRSSWLTLARNFDLFDATRLQRREARMLDFLFAQLGAHDVAHDGDNRA